MILRRIKAHVEAENWFAVGIDFCIVVVGVFIGLQVANWNEARASKVREAGHLSQLRDEIAQTADMVTVQTDFVDHVIEGGRKGLSFLEAGQPCLQDCEALVVAFFHASQVWGTGYPDAKYQETIRLGVPRDETLRQNVLQVYAFIDGWDTVNADPPPYRERVRGMIDADIMTVMWRKCYTISGNAMELLRFDCLDDLRKLDMAPSLNRIRMDEALEAQLRYWIGQNEYARLNYPELLRRADDTMQLINLELKG